MIDLSIDPILHLIPSHQWVESCPPSIEPAFPPRPPHRHEKIMSLFKATFPLPPFRSIIERHTWYWLFDKIRSDPIRSISQPVHIYYVVLGPARMYYTSLSDPKRDKKTYLPTYMGIIITQRSNWSVYGTSDRQWGTYIISQHIISLVDR